jgi:3-deoxy-D-manno-octulosonate 8-phosphate phosphatase (KDO 8-P phosphatase)
MEDIEELFLSIGGEFITPLPLLHERVRNIRAFLFDWDGVFNNGMKGGAAHSLYSEADSMGTNLIRLNYWLQHRSLPFMGIITGETNPAAFELARREHFPTVYFGIKKKQEALQHVCSAQSITPKEVAFFFDDIQDIPIARECGLRFMIRRNASPLFAQYVPKHLYCDYITGHTGGNHAVREVCELIVGLQGNYAKTLDVRIAFGDEYRDYLQQRNTPRTTFYTPQNGTIEPTQPVPENK